MNRRNVQGRIAPLFSKSVIPSGLALVLLLAPGSGATLARQIRSATAAAAGEATRPPRVFLDCSDPAACDLDHFRTEIPFVVWVQDQEVSDVHVIAVSEAAGGGGRRFTFDLVGRGEMAPLSDRLTYTSSGTDVVVETRDALTQLLKLGLLRYALQGGLWQEFAVQYLGAPVSGTSVGAGMGPDVMVPSEFDDPWNFWSFRVGVFGNFNLRETSKSLRFEPSVEADRITDVWKLSFSAGLDIRRSEHELSNGNKVRDHRNEWHARGLIVRSVSDHLSAGIDFGARNSISQNQRVRIQMSPAIEFNYFPYAQATRRQFTIQYGLGVEYSSYAEETIFNVLEETLPEHLLEVRYASRETWGSAAVGLSYSQYLHKGGLYQVGLNADLSFRLARGIDLTVIGNASWQQNEIHTPLASIPDEDILLGRRNLPSDYVYFGRIGISYRFGSPFVNVVNTRFGGRSPVVDVPIGDVGVGG